MSFAALILMFIVGYTNVNLSYTKESSEYNDVISLPLTDGMEATLKAEIDTSKLNKHLQIYIEQQTRKAVDKAMKSVMAEIIENRTNNAKTELKADLQEWFDASLKHKTMFFAFLKDAARTFVGHVGITFDDVIIENENYNPTTGIFTAPIKGVYQISCMLLAVRTNEFHFQVNKNNAVFGYGYANMGNFATNSLTYLMQLEKGDNVSVFHRSKNPEVVHGTRHSYFFGYLLQKL